MPDEAEELRAANAALKEFVAVAAHEIRGPMAAILGYASTTLRRWDVLPVEQKKEFLGIIERRSRYLTRLLDSLLTISKIEAGALEVRAENLDVARAIEQALEDLPERSQVVVRCQPGLRLHADPDHLERVIVNFVRNAQKYGKPPIEIDCRAEGDDLVLSVSDRGDGIPDDFAAELFEKFTRATVEPTERGTGLGLSIVRGLARANGGDAWYEPNHPKGSSFRVRLPQEQR